MTARAVTANQRYVLRCLAERQGPGRPPVAMSGTPRMGGGPVTTPTLALLALERRGLAQATRTGRYIAAWLRALTGDGWRAVERGAGM